jgi:glycerol-3-phosphate O-acyltransferase
MMSVRLAINYFARKLLYLMVKAETLPSNISQLHINPDHPVIYVLEARSWSNLLVLQTECERLGLPSPLSRISAPHLKSWHSVYTIAPRQPFKSWVLKQPKRSRMLRGIVEIQRDHPDEDIQFIPVSIFWGRPVAKQKHWLTVLFADSWGIASRTRKLFTILFHGRDTLVNFSEVINYRSSSFDKNIDDDEIIDRLQLGLSNRLTEIKTATLGPDVSHRRTLVRKLLMNPDVKTSIIKRSAEDSLSEYHATLQARRYLYEIVADCTDITIQILQRGLSTFWNRFYSGIEVTNSEEINKLALTHELIYTPCHRSHIDYLLLSYVIHYEGLAIPYIAAGRNLNMPIIGPILRGGGAFFIRRSFKGNELYSTIMFEYLASLISTGMPIEYFIEGGRSRTGRLLKPKPGMLAMTIRSFLKYRQRPVAFIPVYVGYEKLLESKAYQAELSGEDKKAETFFTSIRNILRIRGEFGKVYANFGKPVFLNQVLDQYSSQWDRETYNDHARPDWLRHVVNDTGNLIMSNINKAASVNAINLVATVMLATAKQHIDENELVKMIEINRSIIESLNYSERTIITSLPAAEQIKLAESLRLVKRRPHELGDIIYLDARRSVSMTYYRNNVLHLLAMPSLIACCFLNMRTHTREELINLVSLAYPFIRAELFLKWKQHELADVIEQILDIMSGLGLLIKNEQLDVYTRAGSGTSEFVQLTMLTKVISPVLEVYYLTLALLSRSKTIKPTRDELENNCYLMAQRVAMIHELNSPDFSDIKLISNFIEVLINMDYVRTYGTEQIEYSEAFQQADKRARLLLSKEMRTNILQMVKSA